MSLPHPSRWGNPDSSRCVIAASKDDGHKDTIASFSAMPYGPNSQGGRQGGGGRRGGRGGGGGGRGGGGRGEQRWWDPVWRAERLRQKQAEMEVLDESEWWNPAPEELKPLSKNAQKKLLKQQRYEAKKAEKKAQAKEQKKKEAERKRKEWNETLANSTEEERLKLIESRKNLRKERMDKRSEEKERKIERLTQAKQSGQNIVVDLEFAHLMSDSEIHSLVQQIMYCYAMNGRSTCPCHLWLTGCEGQINTQLQKLPGFDKWIIEKEDRSYIEAMADQKENLVYLTADSETVLDELDPKKIYIVGGLVDRNRFKGITMTKAQEQGIKTAKLPIGDYLKMSSSQVLTVNQVVEILVKFLETNDWKTSFFAVIPQRKRCEPDVKEHSKCEPDSEEHGGNEGADDECGNEHEVPKSKKLIIRSHEKRPGLAGMDEGYTIDHEVESGKLITLFSAPDYPQFQNQTRHHIASEHWGLDLPLMAASEQRSVERRPGVLVVGSSGVGKRTLLSRLLSVDFDDSFDSSEIAVHGWSINTKYYTADVSVWTAHLGHDFSLPSVPLVALVLVFDMREPSSLVALQDWVSRTDIKTFDILLCIGNKVDLLPHHPAHLEYRRRLLKAADSSGNLYSDIDLLGISDTEGSSLFGGEDPSLDIRKACQDWCWENNIEFIQACASNPDFDKCLSVDGDSQGVERLFGALSAHMWPGMILKTGDKINEPVLPDAEELSEEESEYELEYEVLSAGSADPWEDVHERWVSASEIPSSSDGPPSTSREPFLVDENADKLKKEAEPCPSASMMQPQNVNDIDRGMLINEEAVEKPLDAEVDKLYEIEDLEQLMSEIGNIRDNLRLMPDFQRREMAANLAMKMAAMFGGDSDNEDGHE